MVKIFPAQTEEHFQQIRELIAQYIAWDVSRTAELGLDPEELMRFQYLQGQLDLPGDFAPPQGRLLLATNDATVVGCGAFHPLALDVCEMKRVYVRPQFRGMGIGRLLASPLLANAREAG